MKKIMLLVAASLFVLSTNLNAQNLKPISFGIKGGLNMSNFGGDDISKNVDDKNMILGFNAGVTLDYQLAGSLYLMTGLDFTTKGAKYDLLKVGNSTTSLKFNPMYVQLPIHLGFKVPLADDLNIVLRGGVFAAYGVGGKMKVDVDGDNSTTNLTEVDLFDDNGLNKFDFGVGLGAGVELGKLSLGIGYDLGLANILGDFSIDNTTINDKNKVRTQNAFATVGIKF